MNEMFGLHHRAPASALIAMCYLTLFGAAGGTATAQKLTLDESVKIAVQNNPTVQIAKENVGRADALVRQALSQGMPKLTLIGTYTRLDQITTVSFGPDSFTFGTLETRSVNLVLDQPVDVSGVIRTARGIAKLGTCSVQFGLDQAINDVTLETKVAYFNVLRSRRFLKVQEDTVSLLKAHLKDTETRRQAGDATKFEVLRAETAVANALQGLIAAQNGVHLADSALNTILVRPIDSPVEPAEPAQPKYFTLDLGKVIETAVQRRPELIQADYLVRIDEGFAKIAYLSGKPTVGFRWNYSATLDTSTINPRANSWNALLSATVKIFDGGAAKANTDLAKSEANNARSILEKTRNNISLEAKQSYLSAKETEERVKAAEKALETATESARLAEVRYEGGISTQVEVLDAQAALTEASTNHVSSMFDYQTAVSRLERAVGGRGVLADLIAGSVKTGA